MCLPGHQHVLVGIVVAEVMARHLRVHALGQITLILFFERVGVVLAMAEYKDLTAVHRLHNVHTGFVRLCENGQTLVFADVGSTHLGVARVRCAEDIIKTTDGKFLDTCQKVAKEYPEVKFDDWYIDIMTAKLLDDKRRRDFKVVVLPNLYGDIITDEAAEIQGGVGTAGSANIGKRYAMFEAIHGSAPRMVQEGRAKYADPSSVLRAAVMLLEHIGEIELAKKLDRALDICMVEERKVVVTGRDTGATAQEFTDYVLDTIAKL